jgi:hypothetical protein
MGFLQRQRREDIGHAIQLALSAGVFLLTGIAAMLNVMTGRLARIIDRGPLPDRGAGPWASAR